MCSITRPSGARCRTSSPASASTSPSTRPAACSKPMPSGISKSPHEMARLFRRAPEAIDRTLRFLDRCNFSLDELEKTEYPGREPRRLSRRRRKRSWRSPRRAAQRRYPERRQPKVRHALDRELEFTGELNYAPYFLTVYDIVTFARSKGILCQGRGSAANSVICYCLGITEVDPEKVDLLFERFVSEERKRAARHRRRFRARAARGGDPVHLQQIRPPSRQPRPPPSSAIAAAARSARSARRSGCRTTPSARSPACCGAGRRPA